MALIDCPGCGNKVSDRAKACPKCGMNLSLKKKQEEQLKEVKHNNLKVDEQPKQLDQPKVQTEELKKIKEEETDKPIFKEEVKEERTSKPNLEEKTKEPEKIISKEISEPEKKKKGNKFWLAIGLIIGFILGVLFWFVLALIIPDDKIPSAGGNTGTTVVGGTDSQSTENSGSSKKTDVSGATLAFKYVDVSLIPNGLGEGTYKVGKDIDSGEYIAYGLNSVSQIKQFNSLDEQEDTEEIDGLFIDLTLEENQYIEVESGSLRQQMIKHDIWHADLLKLIFIMRNEGYTLIEIAEQAREDFAMEFDGCTQKDVVRVVSKLANRNNGILQSLVAEILEQYE